MKQKEIQYNGDYRKNNLKGCYKVRFRNYDEEHIIIKYTNLIFKRPVKLYRIKNIVVDEPIIEKVIEPEISIKQLENLFSMLI